MATRFWHGFADMHLVKDLAIVFRAGHGVWLEDVEGRRYLDATAGLWYCNVGLGRHEIAEAVSGQLVRLAACSSFGRYTSEPTLLLSERLVELGPVPDAVTFLASGGSDAIDTAMKLARRYWDVMGRPEKRVVVSREHGYHGMHAWGTSLSGIPANKAGYGGDLIEEIVHVGAHDIESLAAVFERRGSEIAAFVGEPVIGAGGVIPPEPSYWPEVQRLCREYEILLIADEVITGFGRLGAMWGSSLYGIEPDMLTFAKGVTSGYAALGGVLIGRRVREPFWEGSRAGAVFRHGYTYGGHAAACTAALANLEILEREGLVARVSALEPVLAAALRQLESLPLIEEVRTAGLAGAVAFRRDALEVDPEIPDRVVAAALHRGVATRALRGDALQVSPAFVISESEMATLTEGLGLAIQEVGAQI